MFSSLCFAAKEAGCKVTHLMKRIEGEGRARGG